MNRKTTHLRKKLLFLLIPVLVGVTYWGSTVLSFSTRKEKSVIKVNNLTRSCELLNPEKHKDHIQLSVQNNSDKAITAFVLTSPIDSRTVYTVKEEFAFSEGDLVIFPGQRYDKIIGIPDSLNRMAEITLNLSAAIFADGSSEGDPKTIGDIEDNRLGQKIQLMKALPVLEKLARLSEAEVSVYLRQTAKHDLEVAFDMLNTESLIKLNKKPLSNGRLYTESEQFELGIQEGKESVFQKVQELKDLQEKQGTKALREGVIRVRDLYSKMITKL
jgi:hypothetical protein